MEKLTSAQQRHLELLQDGKWHNVENTKGLKLNVLEALISKGIIESKNNGSDDKFNPYKDLYFRIKQEETDSNNDVVIGAHDLLDLTNALYQVKIAKNKNEKKKWLEVAVNKNKFFVERALNLAYGKKSTSLSLKRFNNIIIREDIQEVNLTKFFNTIKAILEKGTRFELDKSEKMTLQNLLPAFPQHPEYAEVMSSILTHKYRLGLPADDVKEILNK